MKRRLMQGGVPDESDCLKEHSAGTGGGHRRKAEEQRISFSKVVIRLLEERLGQRGQKRKSRPRHHDLDGLAGSWTEDEAAIFEETLARQRAIDQDLTL